MHALTHLDQYNFNPASTKLKQKILICGLPYIKPHLHLFSTRIQYRFVYYDIDLWLFQWNIIVGNHKIGYEIPIEILKTCKKQDILISMYFFAIK